MSQQLWDNKRWLERKDNNASEAFLKDSTLFKNLILLQYGWFYHVVLTSAVPQSDSITYDIAFYILLYYSLSEDIECSTLHYIVGPWCWAVHWITVCIGQFQTPISSLLHHLFPLATKSLLLMSVSLFLILDKFICDTF